jgi:hypothetical protein
MIAFGISKQFFIVVACAKIYSSPAITVHIFMYFTLAHLAFVAYKMPMAKKTDNYLELFNLTI